MEPNIRTDAVEVLPHGTQRFHVIDGRRPVSFIGWQIGQADSQNGEDVRWTELSMYKTLTGKYVIEKIGRSDVIHSDTCRRTSKGKRYETLAEAREEKEARDNETLEDLFVPCPDCAPAYDTTPVWAERDISSISSFPTADDAIRSLYRGDRRDGAGAATLSRVARALLESAASVDEAVRVIFERPVDIT